MRSAGHSLAICKREAAPHSRPCRILAVLGVLGVLAARLPMKFLAGGPATGMVALLAGGPATFQWQSLWAAQPSNNFQKISFTPLRVVCGFGILAPSADGPGSRKERDDLVLLGG